MAVDDRLGVVSGMSSTKGIRELIQGRRGERSLESLSQACGGVPTRANLDRLINKPVRSWPKDTGVIIGLSKGLGVRVGDVIDAYAVSLGLPIEPSDDDLVLPGAGKLPEVSKQILRDTAANLFLLQEREAIALSSVDP